MKLNNP